MGLAIFLVSLSLTSRVVAAIPIGRPTVLGRSARCDVVIDHHSISRRHAKLTAEKTQVLITDCGSTNGTFIGDRIVTSPATAPAGSQIRFGRVAFVLVDFDNRYGGQCLPPSEHETPFVESEFLADSPVSSLSVAQRRVFDLLLEGKSEKQIAVHLHISRCTAHNHVSAIYKTFGVHSRSELLVSALPRRKPL